LTHSTALKTSAGAAAFKITLEVADVLIVEPTELVATTARRSFLVANVLGKTIEVLSKVAIGLHTPGTLSAAAELKVPGQLYHLYVGEFTPKSSQTPTFATTVFPVVKDVGLNDGDVVLVGAVLIGPKPALNVLDVPASD